MSKFFKIFDKYFTKVEKKGFHVANFLHKSTIVLIMGGMCYTIYSSMVDYNNYFIEIRRENKIKEENQKFFNKS